MEINADSVTRLRVYIAGHGMPTDAFIQIIDRQNISGNTMHVIKANIVLSPREPYSNAKMKTARVFLFCSVLKYWMTIY